MMPEIIALVVTSTGGVTTVTIEEGRFQQAFREHCGAQYFDKLSIADDVDMWVDDEGLLVSDPDVNLFATVIRNVFWRVDRRIDQERVANYPPVAGTAMFTGGAGASGRTKSLSDERLGRLIGLVVGARGFLAETP